MENNECKRKQQERRTKKIIAEYGSVSKEFLKKAKKIKTKGDEEGE